MSVHSGHAFEREGIVVAQFLVDISRVCKIQSFASSSCIHLTAESTIYS